MLPNTLSRVMIFPLSFTFSSLCWFLRLSRTSSFFFFNDTATTEIYTLSLHDALPIFADLPLTLPPGDPGCVWNQFVVRVFEGKRDALRAHLAARGVATAVYYPTPLHLQPCVRHLGHRRDRKSTRLNSSHQIISYAVFS